MNSVVSF